MSFLHNLRIYKVVENPAVFATIFLQIEATKDIGEYAGFRACIILEMVYF